MLRRQLERHGRWLVAIVVLVAVACASGGWILVNQRLRTPFDDTYAVRAEFATSAGLTPGLGQPVNVAGVRVGSIANVRLRDGRAIVGLAIDPAKLPRVHRDAHAMLVPNTPLQDMQVELAPGRPSAGELGDDAVIPVAQTTPPVNPDELTGVLDADTRSLFRALLSGVDGGTRGRGDDLRDLLRAFKPTAEQLRAVSSGLVDRRRRLRHLVHNLALLTSAAGADDSELSRAVRAGGDVLQAVSAPERELRAAVAKLPGTVAAAREGIAAAQGLADELRPAAEALLPAASHAPAAVNAAGRLALTAEPVLRTRVRPLVRRVQPVARDLAPATADLSAVTPSLSSAFQVLTYLVNEIGYNPPGDDEGFVSWMTWFGHNVNSFTSTGDAHGAIWRGLGLFDCTIVSKHQVVNQLLAAVFAPLEGCS